ncbi:piggyBac transposable element-derived protein 3-like [Anthonomus grandis grandis]|uniref:piggyBac transposable element-derived protein 3-like n=1 Tax=Anthonomus grandis grandis TaxID=2921223 RepID=UPI00216641C8|nr:piggyBac transposable element-derived protein 3-like [Anthonomus grandis grandis]
MTAEACMFLVNILNCIMSLYKTEITITNKKLKSSPDTHEEEFSEDPENIENSQNGDIAGTFEIHSVRDEIYDKSDEEDFATKRRKILEKKAFSEKYAQDNRHEFHLSPEELLHFLGILILSGYHSLPQTDMYWSLDEDKTVHIVRDCMNRNKFRSIKRNLHLSDNNNLDKGYKYTKLRPFFDEKFLQFGIFSFNLSIDEQMVPYFGRHSCKMFIKGKPVRFGFKLWCICSSSGYLYKFIPYTGAAMKNSDIGLGATVAVELLSIVKNPQNHNVFFDNFFLSYKLLSLLKTKSYFATETIRENRTSHCPLVDNKVIPKKERGTYDSKFDESTQISLVKWNDSSIVTAISTHYHVEPLTSAKRYNRKSKKEVSIPQPAVISRYKYMGGVDLHDNGVANYRIGVMELSTS